MTPQPEQTHMNLLFALTLSREHAAYQQVILPTFGYELIKVTQDETDVFTFTVAFWEDRENGLPDAPHFTRECSYVEDVLKLLDDLGVPTDRWYPVEEVNDANAHL